MKKPIVHLSFYIDAKGFSWLAFEKLPKGTGRVLGQWKQSFSDILGGSEFAGQTPSINPIQASQNVAQVVSWLKSAAAKNALKDIVAKLPAKPAKVHLCFSETFSVFRYFSMPKVEKMYWKKAIPIEARKYLPFSIQECIYDWRATEVVISGKPFLGVVFSAMRKEIFEAVTELLAHVGAKCDLIDSLPFAIARSVQSIGSALPTAVDLAKETALVVYLDLEQVQMILFAKGVPILPRSIYMAGASQRGSLTLERRKLDLEMTLDFVRKQLGMDALSRILLLSSVNLDDASLKNWASGISEELGLKVEVIRPLRTGLSGTGESSGIEAGDWADLAVIGTSLSGSIAMLEPYELNMARLTLETPPKQIVIKKVWMAAGALAAAVIALGFLREVSVRNQKTRLQQMSSSMESGLPEIKDKDAEDIKGLALAKTQSLTALRSALSPQGRFYLTKVLQSVAENIPRGAWIDGLSYNSPGLDLGAESGRKNSVSLVLSGRVENKGTQTDSVAVQEFFKQLKEVPMLVKKFPAMDISFQKVDPGRHGRLSKNAAAAVSSGDFSVLTFSIDFKSDGKNTN